MPNKNTLQNLILFLILSSFPLDTIYAQQLSAKVIDENNEPVIGANVYFDGTTIGVITDFEGYFNIKSPKNLSIPHLVISFLGYETIYIKDIQSLKSTYVMEVKPDNLDTVNVYTEYLFSRKELERAFNHQFLGIDIAARKSKILNMNDLFLYYVEEEKALYAKSYNPIEIENNYLGYNIKFELKGFKVEFNKEESISYKDTKSAYYEGNRFFEVIDDSKKKNRKKSFEGTFKHFLKALLDNNLSKEKFKIFMGGAKIRPKGLFKIKKINENYHEITLNKKLIKYQDGGFIPVLVEIYKKNKESIVTFTQPSFRVDHKGNNLDINHMTLSGHFANYSKVGRLLPSDYRPNE